MDKPISINSQQQHVQWTKNTQPMTLLTVESSFKYGYDLFLTSFAKLLVHWIKTWRSFKHLNKYSLILQEWSSRDRWNGTETQRLHFISPRECGGKIHPDCSLVASMKSKALLRGMYIVLNGSYLEAVFQSDLLMIHPESFAKSWGTWTWNILADVSWFADLWAVGLSQFSKHLVMTWQGPSPFDGSVNGDAMLETIPVRIRSPCVCYTPCVGYQSCRARLSSSMYQEYDFSISLLRISSW